MKRMSRSSTVRSTNSCCLSMAHILPDPAPRAAPIPPTGAPPLPAPARARAPADRTPLTHHHRPRTAECARTGASAPALRAQWGRNVRGRRWVRVGVVGAVVGGVLGRVGG
ncbi:hypothetical protein CUD01_13500 [Cellulomonas uda]|uniref:Uncharacterized protein n=1 Tax=Cellulomonas uda TaxID=1714 RepID=A0A4Y3KB45_CELUD|nr:hypothetical protein CUD01_13500 [Cellulomonas uda]